MKKRNLLTQWLRGKNYHINDIKLTLDWYEQEIINGSNPTDDDVLKRANDSYEAFLLNPTSTVKNEKSLIEAEESTDKALDYILKEIIFDVKHLKMHMTGMTILILLIILSEVFRWLWMAYHS